MTALQIQSSVEKRKLQLNKQQRLNYYLPAHAALLIGLGLPVMTVWDWLIDGRIDGVLSGWEIALFSTPWLIGAVLLYKHPIRILELSKVTTPLKVSEIRELLVDLAHREGWTIQNNRKTFMVLKTHPGFTWNWGERITVLFHNDEVWVNSICDPDSDLAFYSSGRNKQNRKLIHEHLSGNRRILS